MKASKHERSSLLDLRARHREIYVLVSPPRCCSTLVARVFWEHPAIRYYSHEPFEETYYDGAGIETALAKLKHPVDLAGVAKQTKPAGSNGLIIKEMPYQAGENFDYLVTLATQPVIFLVRDPRLSISSRRMMKVEGGESADYPELESGWHLLTDQVNRCRKRNVPFVIVDTTDCRRRPKAVFGQVLESVGLEFSPAQLSWNRVPALPLDNLDGRHEHLYSRVLDSTCILAPTETVPQIESFPTENGTRDHVIESLGLYQGLLADRRRIGQAGAVEEVRSK